ncbi:helix-turn-helix transcriptional regulator_gp144 [Bacillus phage vB_BceM_WH1]|nr:helix-turn-helix transcriptional regulator_gp144 [Bacillus phage vB_BceM_WH1]
MNSHCLGNVEEIYQQTMVGLVEQLKKRRQEKGLTQKQLSKLATIDTKTIQKIETGKWLPSMRSLMLMSEALDMTLFFDLRIK